MYAKGNSKYQYLIHKYFSEPHELTGRLANVLDTPQNANA